jgi:lipid-A-disaccharide synthase
VALRVLVSAGEASGDLYASALVARLRAIHPDAEFFGCAGPRMRREKVEAVVESESLSVVGLVEVVAHIPRIYGEFRKLVRVARERRPDLAILTDSPDFHLRLARRLHGGGIPVIYLVAPQVWAWRRGRVRNMRETIRHLLCIFPFEEPFFRDHGVPATYIGHPLARMVRPSMTKTQFFEQHGIPAGSPLVAVLPGSRPGEIARHLEAVAAAVREILRHQPACRFFCGTPPGFSRAVRGLSFWERFGRESIQVIEGSTWDLLAHADLALAASGTVTIEAALLSTPMVTFYKVSELSWLFGRRLVRVPFLSMVNLVAGRKIVPELIQDDLKPDRLASEALHLLEDGCARERMRSELEAVRGLLSQGEHPMDAAVRVIETVLDKDTVNVK